MLAELLWLLWHMTAGAICALMVSSTVRYKRPKRCRNCGRRPRWVFDTKSGSGQDIDRNHAKECIQ